MATTWHVLDAMIGVTRRQYHHNMYHFFDNLGMVIDSHDLGDSPSWFVIQMPGGSLQVLLSYTEASADYPSENWFPSHTRGHAIASSSTGGWDVGEDNPAIAGKMFSNASDGLWLKLGAYANYSASGSTFNILASVGFDSDKFFIFHSLDNDFWSSGCAVFELNRFIPVGNNYCQLCNGPIFSNSISYMNRLFDGNTGLSRSKQAFAADGTSIFIVERNSSPFSSDNQPDSDYAYLHGDDVYGLRPIEMYCNSGDQERLVGEIPMDIFAHGTTQFAQHKILSRRGGSSHVICIHPGYYMEWPIGLSPTR